MNLEEKVDRIEEVLEDFEYGYAEPASERGRPASSRAGSTGSRASSTGCSPPSKRRPERRRQEVTSRKPTARLTEIRATDAARRKAGELGVDLAEVEGTGNGGQITVDDVRRKGES